MDGGNEVLGSEQGVIKRLIQLQPPYTYFGGSYIDGANEDFVPNKQAPHKKYLNYIVLLRFLSGLLYTRLMEAQAMNKRAYKVLMAIQVSLHFWESFIDPCNEGLGNQKRGIHGTWRLQASLYFLRASTGGCIEGTSGSQGVGVGFQGLLSLLHFWVGFYIRGFRECIGQGNVFKAKIDGFSIIFRPGYGSLQSRLKYTSRSS